MPGKKSEKKLIINIDLLQPQGSSPKVYLKLAKWALSSGKYMIIFVEALVLIAFFARFKLDADLVANKELADQKIPFIQSLQSDEVLVRQTQQQLANIRTVRQTSPDYTILIDKIAKQTPQQITLFNINVQQEQGRIDILMNGQSQGNLPLSAFLFGLREDGAFSSVTLSNIGIDGATISFNILVSSSVGAAKK